MDTHTDVTGKVCPMSGHEAFAWGERSTREAVWPRSGGVCEYCRSARAQEMHHRKSRGVGGRWSPANILHLCSRCHHRFTNEARVEGYERGVLLRRNQEPQEVAVRTLDDTVLWLSDDVAPPLGKVR